MLSFTDILVLCMPLAAAILALMKDTFKEEKPGAKKKITPFGVTALFLAVIGFVLSGYSTYQTKKEAKQKSVASNLSAGFTESQERIKATLGITETKINETIHSVQTRISDVVNGPNSN